MFQVEKEVLIFFILPVPKKIKPNLDYCIKIKCLFEVNN